MNGEKNCIEHPHMLALLQKQQREVLKYGGTFKTKLNDSDSDPSRPYAKAGSSRLESYNVWLGRKY